MLLLRGYRKCIAKFVLPPLDVVHRHAESTKVDGRRGIIRIFNNIHSFHKMKKMQNKCCIISEIYYNAIS